MTQLAVDAEIRTVALAPQEDLPDVEVIEQFVVGIDHVDHIDAAAMTVFISLKRIFSVCDPQVEVSFTTSKEAFQGSVEMVASSSTFSSRAKGR